MQSAPSRPSRVKRSRRTAYVTLLIAGVLIGFAVAVWLKGSGLMSRWKGPEDWRGVSVTRTTLEQTGWRKYVEGGAWRNLPFDLSANEMRDLGRCQRLALRQGVTIDGVNQFLGEEIRDELESLLKQRPTLFYAEYALAKWYAGHGEAAKAEELMRRAYADAPVVLVQRYEYPDGAPAAGLRLRNYGIECNRVKKHSWDPSLELMYWDLTTDEKGCIYLPVYQTVYRTDSMSYPGGLKTEYPKLGWFSVRGKVGELPVAVVRK